jgi:NAD(P)-dependent dehydrogenase (short-subunit alcohol dehydrogenase family)
MALAIDGVALVTGAGESSKFQQRPGKVSNISSMAIGSGIGRECCLAYAAEGARGVVMADLNYVAALQTAHDSEVVATHPEYKALAVAVDVSDPFSVKEMIKKVVDVFGRIDYNVNSAGVGVQKPLPVEDADLVEMNRFWQVNVMGTLNCMQAVTKVMKNQEPKTYSSRGKVRQVERGVILNLGSCNSYVPTPNIVQYTTTKHAVLGMTRNAGKFFEYLKPVKIQAHAVSCTALDNAPHGIRVNAICPGWVETPMVDAAIAGDPNLPQMMKTIIPMSRIAKVEEIADVVMFMTSPSSSYVTGVGWLVDGGTTLQVQTC